jgi:predicted glycosyltransferase
MRIWYDACTGKQVRYAIAIAKKFRSEGHEVIFTTREHPDTIPLAKGLGEDPLVVGKYAPTTLASRLEESAERIIQFAKMFRDKKPDVAIAHQSVELCRVAFGLGIPIITTADTPYAYAVNRLTLPFAHTVVVSEALPKSFTADNGAHNVAVFRGVDEVAWIKGFNPKKTANAKKPLIVVRQIENRAVYADKKQDNVQTLAQRLAELGNVHVVQRYNNENEEVYKGKLGFEDTAELVAHADLVVSYGGTITREAALQGVPSIGISDMAKTYVNTYLTEKGFPLFATTEDQVIEVAKQYLGKRFDVADKLAALENPVDVIADIAKNITRQK